MNDIDAVQEHLRKLYEYGGQSGGQAPLPYQAAAYAVYANDYLRSAGVLKDSEPLPHRTLMPWYQLMGQALELSMKACLAVAGVSPPRTHDLVALCKKVEAAGFVLGVEHAHAHLVHLNHGYYEDLATGDRFVARYGGGGSKAVPDHDRLSAVCTELLRQAKEGNPIYSSTPRPPSS